MSRVYQEIVVKNRKNNQKDIRYFVAYSLYKQQKKEFIENYQLKNGKPPNKEQLSEFQDTLTTKSSLESLYAKTDRILLVYGDTVFKNKLEQFNKIHTQINEKKFFWGGVTQSIIGSLIFALSIFVIGLMINFSKEGGIKEILRQWLESN